jgi:hypothetical protein
MSDTPLTDARAYQLQADGLVDADFARKLERENSTLLALLRRHHNSATDYSRSLRRAMSTCAEFKTDPIRALIESAYMESLGNETAAAIERGDKQ